MCFKLYGYKRDFNALSFSSAFSQYFCVNVKQTFSRGFNFSTFFLSREYHENKSLAKES